MRLLSASLFLLFAAGACSVADPSKAPPELGSVKWGRDLEAALAASAKTGKPVLLLFQEVPG